MTLNLPEAFIKAFSLAFGSTSAFVNVGKLLPGHCLDNSSRMNFILKIKMRVNDKAKKWGKNGRTRYGDLTFSGLY